MPVEKLLDLTFTLFSDNAKKQPPKIDIENYGTYTKIEL